MAITRHKLGPRLWYYQYNSATNMSDRFYFAQRDEAGRREALRLCRAFKKFLRTSKQSSEKTWRGAQLMNQRLSIANRNMTMPEQVSCELNFDLYD